MPIAQIDDLQVAEPGSFLRGIVDVNATLVAASIAHQTGLDFVERASARSTSDPPIVTSRDWRDGAIIDHCVSSRAPEHVLEIPALVGDGEVARTNRATRGPMPATGAMMGRSVPR